MRNVEILIAAVAVAAAGISLSGTSTLAQGLGDGISGLAPGEIGGFIDNIHGNATNDRASGNGVTPSLAPGPWTCGASCNGPTDGGGSIGEFFAPVASGGAASPDFADGQDKDIDFSEPYDHGGVTKAVP